MRRVNCIQNETVAARRSILRHLIEEEFVSHGDIEPIVNAMIDLYSDKPAYGSANVLDFRDLSDLFATLFAFDNKHYYVYKAISNPNKLGFLSHKQYMKLLGSQRYWRDLYSSREQFKRKAEFLKEYGTMASPLKLLKRAFKENPVVKGLANMFPLEEDGTTTKNEWLIIKICDYIMQTNTGMDIVEAKHVQECYDLDLYDPDYRGSGSRFATSSCMYQRPVGEFYEAFGAKGMLVYRNGEPIGRFLKWTLPDGQEYIDRLYTKGSYANDALAEIDKRYPNALKYPIYRINRRAGEDDNPVRFFVPIAKPEMFEKTLTIPYVDSFCYLVEKGGKLMLSNKSCNDAKEGVSVITTFNNTRDNRHFHSCPACHSVWFDNSGVSKSAHNLYCTHYMPRNKSLQAMLKIFRDGLKHMEEKPNDQRITFESIFQV